MAGRPKRREEKRKLAEAIANASALAAGCSDGVSAPGPADGQGVAEKQAGPVFDPASGFYQKLRDKSGPEQIVEALTDSGAHEDLTQPEKEQAVTCQPESESAHKGDSPLCAAQDKALFAKDAQGDGNANAIFETAEELFRAVNSYFDECDRRKTLYGEAGLCLWLSRHNGKNRPVTLDTLRRWYDGERCEYLQETVRYAYMRIQSQIETDPRYQGKGGMSTRAIFLLKQPRLGGYQDKQEDKHDVTVKIIHDSTIDDSLFE